MFLLYFSISFLSLFSVLFPFSFPCYSTLLILTEESNKKQIICFFSIIFIFSFSRFSFLFLRFFYWFLLPFLLPFLFVYLFLHFLDVQFDLQSMQITNGNFIPKYQTKLLRVVISKIMDSKIRSLADPFNESQVYT